MGPEIEYCGQTYVVERDPFTIGRIADLVIDDCRSLHRRFLRLSVENGIWLLANVGSRLTATMSDTDGRLEAFLAPGSVLPLVFEQAVVRFSSGSTSYELRIRLPDAIFRRAPIDFFSDGATTVGAPTLTPDQLLLVIALAEPVLRGDARPMTALRSAAEVSSRLGWTTTRYNRKLDNVCQKLSAQGVRGLHGDPGRLASNRRSRLVEYALAVQLVTTDDLVLLDAHLAT